MPWLWWWHIVLGNVRVVSDTECTIIRFPQWSFMIFLPTFGWPLCWCQLMVAEVFVRWGEILIMPLSLSSYTAPWQPAELLAMHCCTLYPNASFFGQIPLCLCRWDTWQVYPSVWSLSPSVRWWTSALAMVGHAVIEVLFHCICSRCFPVCFSSCWLDVLPFWQLLWC